MTGLYESLFRHAVYPAYETVWRGRSTLAYLREYEAQQWLSPEALAALQWRKIERLLAHCWNEVPYYRRAWAERGVAGPQDIRTEADFARLPVLTKADARANWEDLVAPSRRADLMYKATSGSTGEPLRLGYTRECYERRMAVMWRGYGWAGARMGQRTLYLWAEPTGGYPVKDRLYNRLFNRLVLSAFGLDDDHMPAYADAFDSFKPETVVTYVAPIVRLADWLIATGRQVRPPRRILTAAEALHRVERERVERAFGCEVFDTYGCREAMLIASECQAHDGLHLTEDHVKVELGAPLDGSPDAPGDVILTDLHNFGMPMVRYANGDLATAAPGPCGCGRGLGRLGRVEGRRLDALRTSDGRFVPGEYIVYAFLAVEGVDRFQVRQRTLERWEVSIVPSAAFEPSMLDPLRDALARVAGPGVSIDLSLTDAIPATAAGKRRVTISDLQ